MNMRSKFTAPGTSIYYYEAGKFAGAKLGISLWETFVTVGVAKAVVTLRAILRA